MLIEIWERFRGYDRWIPVEATIHSSEMEDQVVETRYGPNHLYVSADCIVWIDGQGNRHTADCEVPSDSPLYQLIGGEKVAIRYKPDNPDEYYFPELLKARLRNYSVGLLTVLLFLSLIVVPIFLFFYVFNRKL
jgi:hypothetical protein